MPKIIGHRTTGKARGKEALCLNFVEGGDCHLTSGKCLLGLGGALAENRKGECEFHGNFDVWVTQKNQLLITDMGFPSEEPKQCLALGINENLARKIALDKVDKLGTCTLTTERRCLKCGKQFWITQHTSKPGLLETGKGYFCPDCFGEDESKEERLGVLRYWCG
jgi:DNA-directed RNA polymerase subunit RPC12/RpoP